MNTTDWRQYLPPGGDARHQRQVGHEEPLRYSDLQDQAKRCLQKRKQYEILKCKKKLKRIPAKPQYKSPGREVPSKKETI